MFYTPPGDAHPSDNYLVSSQHFCIFERFILSVCALIRNRKTSFVGNK